MLSHKFYVAPQQISACARQNVELVYQMFLQKTHARGQHGISRLQISTTDLLGQSRSNVDISGKEVGHSSAD